MADEQTPTPGQAENPTPIDPENAPEPIQEMQAKTIREIRRETVPPEDQPPGAREFREAESPEATQARREVEAVLDTPINAIEDAAVHLDQIATPQHPSDVLPHVVPDVTHVFGRFTVPLPIYDVVFISLAIFTVIEVLVGTALGANWLTVLVLLSIAFVKAAHVVLYYMHLITDNRIFWATLLIPFFIATLGLLYLVVVPPTGY